MTRLIFRKTLLLAAACTTEVPTLVQDGPTHDAEVSVVWQATPHIEPIGGMRALASNGATVLLIDPRLAEPLDLGIAAGEVRGGALLEDQILVATDEDLFTWDGRVWRSPLADSLPSLPDHLASDGRALWLEADGGLHRLADGHLRGIAVQGQAPLGPRLLGAAVDGVPATWVSVLAGDSPGAMALADDGALLTHVYVDDVRSIGADSSGHSWVADGVELHDRYPDGTWTAWRFDTAVAHVAANPASDQLWVKTVDAVYYGTSAGVSTVNGVPDGQWQGADAMGRLRVRSPEGISVVSVGRPLALLDLPEEGLTDRATATLVVSQPALVSAVTWTMDEQPALPPEGPPWSISVAPTELTKGSHELVAAVTWSDGETGELRRTFDVTTGLVTWNDHVVKIFEDHCALCHDGASETKLDNPEAWQEKIETIWEQVETGGMPLGKDPLSAEKLDLIDAWRASGFLRGDE